MVSNAVSQSFARKVEAEGVTVAEWVFLRAMYDVKRISPTGLAGQLGMTKGAISKLADRLIEKAFVEREANPNDKRAQTLVLTQAGRALVPRLAALADENDTDFFGALSAGDRRRLDEILRRIAESRQLIRAPID